MERALLQGFLEEGLSLAEIGARTGRHEATVAYWLRKHGLEAANRQRHLSRGALQREQLEALADRGMSLAEIAECVNRSKATVRYWLKEHGLRTGRAVERQLRARDAGLIVRECPRHGLTGFTVRPDSGSRCLRCRSEAVTRRRRKVKLTLVQQAGGACQLCGYDRCVAALEFHHLVPEDKRFAVSLRMARSLASTQAEARKCVLLCANCHAEVEAGQAMAPVPPMLSRIPLSRAEAPG